MWRCSCRKHALSLLGPPPLSVRVAHLLLLPSAIYLLASAIYLPAASATCRILLPCGVCHVPCAVWCVACAVGRVVYGRCRVAHMLSVSCVCVDECVGALSVVSCCARSLSACANNTHTCIIYIPVHIPISFRYLYTCSYMAYMAPVIHTYIHIYIYTYVYIYILVRVACFLPLPSSFFLGPLLSSSAVFLCLDPLFRLPLPTAFSARCLVDAQRWQRHLALSGTSERGAVRVVRGLAHGVRARATGWRRGIERIVFIRLFA